MTPDRREWKGKLNPVPSHEHDVRQLWQFPEDAYLLEPLSYKIQKSLLYEYEDADGGHNSERVVMQFGQTDRDWNLKLGALGGIIVSIILAATLSFGFVLVAILLGLGYGVLDSRDPGKKIKDWQKTHLPYPGGVDPQMDNVLVSIEAVVSDNSNAGWNDDLWQTQFAIARMIEEKKSLTSERLAEKLYDEIDLAMDDLQDMIAARVHAIQKRERLGLNPIVPGNEKERIEAGATAEMEELAMSPYIADLVARSRDERGRLGPGRGDADEDTD